MDDNFQNIKSTPKMMIGTVQFGIPYGIAKNQGQPSNEEVMAIMKHAHESGVDEYDTAAAYGESEKRLGYNFKELGISKNVSLYTKIKPLRAEISKSPKESDINCFKPKEILSLSASIDCINASTISPLDNLLIDSSFSSQEISDKCTRPSMPPSSSINTPKSVIDLKETET